MQEDMNNIKTPQDILDFMNKYTDYGWVDINGDRHVHKMDNFRRLYITRSTEEMLNSGLGVCIEQVYLMHLLLDKINIPNKMFCTRIYEGDNFDDLDAEEHIHCFVLHYLNGKVYQIEHPNMDNIGIHDFLDEETAIKEINNYYIKQSGGKARPVTEFFEVTPGLSFKEFNQYINSLDEYKKTK